MKTIIISLVLALLIMTVPKNVFSQISENDKIGLFYLLEEEKLAYDIYSEMYKKYNHKVFENIMKAEKVHQEHILNLLKTMDIDADQYYENPGEFTNKNLQDLYNDFILTGNYSLSDAFRAGAMIEETDIKDLRDNFSKTNDATIKALYECLDNASQNHLRAFVRNLKREDINYSPKVLSKEDFDLIISSKNKPGNCFTND